jgi:ubiquinone/menaquinone biosynthesis C-methylase UbiE
VSSRYDEHVAFYLDFVDQRRAGFLAQLAVMEDLLGDRVRGARVCDLGCGEGYFGRHLVTRGAASVVGVDLSSGLIEEARRRADAPNLEYRVDDARELATIEDGSVDLVVSQLALMDMADHDRVFRSVRRVLQPSGAFLFSILHPCYEGAPFHHVHEPRHLVDADDTPTAFVVRHYATEGYWESGGDGVRGRMGSYHRTLSTYVNDLVDAGFAVDRLREPVVDARGGLFAEVPMVLLVLARAL